MAARALDGKPPDIRVVVATGVAAGMFALAERGWAEGAVALAWSALVSVLFVRLGDGPAPVEVFLKVFNAAGPSGGGGGVMRPAATGGGGFI